MKGNLLPHDFTRRRFLQTAAASTALALPIISSAQTKPATTSATAPVTTTAAPPPAPPKLKIGIVGVGGRGWDHVREISAIPSAEIVALCDVDVTNLVNAARAATG